MDAPGEITLGATSSMDTCRGATGVRRGDIPALPVERLSAHGEVAVGLAGCLERDEENGNPTSTTVGHRDDPAYVHGSDGIDTPTDLTVT